MEYGIEVGAGGKVGEVGEDIGVIREEGTGWWKGFAKVLHSSCRDVSAEVLVHW